MITPTEGAVHAFMRSLAEPKTFLDTFLSDARVVARNLRRREIKGRRREPRDCPIANALSAEFPGHDWSVTATRIRNGVTVPTTFAVEDFITGFDFGKFRYLRK